MSNLHDDPDKVTLDNMNASLKELAKERKELIEKLGLQDMKRPPSIAKMREMLAEREDKEAKE